MGAFDRNETTKIPKLAKIDFCTECLVLGLHADSIQYQNPNLIAGRVASGSFIIKLKLLKLDRKCLPEQNPSTEKK